VLRRPDPIGLSRPAVPARDGVCHPIPNNWVAKSVATLGPGRRVSEGTDQPPPSIHRVRARKRVPSIRPRAVQTERHAEDKRMTTYVYDYPSGTARFYIEGEYVFPVSGTLPAFWINGGYWYPNPPTGTPAFSVSGKFVYEHPASSTPRYYLS
jgi:hypothetical protein